MTCDSGIDIKGRITKLETDMDRLRQIVNGDENTEVAIDTGVVPSIARLIQFIVNSAQGLVPGYQEFEPSGPAGSDGRRRFTLTFKPALKSLVFVMIDSVYQRSQSFNLEDQTVVLTEDAPLGSTITVYNFGRLSTIDGIPVLRIGTVTTGAPGSQASAEVVGDPGDPILNLTIPQGPVGPVGPVPNFTIGTITTGAAGSAADATITGTAANPVLNLTIPRGNTGATGLTPNLTIGSVTTGAPGSTAGATITGTQTNPVLNLTIPRGDVGPVAAFSIGTVTTGAPGSSAAATITGAAAAPVLNLTIPRGDTGAPGAGSGDVNGPASATNNAVALFDGVTGKLLKDGGTLGTAAFAATGDFATASHTHDAANIVSGTVALARLPVAASGASSATQVVRADDSRLSDARTPTAHTHTASQISDSTATGRALLTAADAAAARSNLGAAASGAITSSGLTMATARLLGRATANTGAVEEITVGPGLTLSGGQLTASAQAPGKVLLAVANASNAVSVDFTTGIDSTYDCYVVEFDNVVPGTDGSQLRAAFYATGAWQNSGYQTYLEYPNVINLTYVATGTSSGPDIMLSFNWGNDASLGETGGGLFYLFNPAGTGRQKFARFFSAHSSPNNFLIHCDGSGSWRDASHNPVTGIRFTFTGGSTISGNFRLYGLRKTG